MSLSVVFAGTPEFAEQSLRALLAAGYQVPLVLTQPDRRSGRGMRLQPSPVKQAAVEADIPVAQPVRLRLEGEHAAQAQAVKPSSSASAPEGWWWPPMGSFCRSGSSIYRVMAASIFMPVYYLVGGGLPRSSGPLMLEIPRPG